MKTAYKVIILVLFAIGAITGVFIFAKTQVAPPEGVEPIDQYSKALTSASGSLNSSGSDIDAQRTAYLAMDDKIKRYLAEEVVTATQADNVRKTIDETYGGQLTAFGFDLFSKSVWPDSDIKKLVSYMDELGRDVLTTGDVAAPQTFFTNANELKYIVDKYNKALALSRNTGFGNVNSARERINRAREYKNDTYLRNNVALVEALDKVPEKIGNSHYNYVISVFNKVNNYRSYSEYDFNNVVVPQISQAKKDYDAQSYPNKKSISDAYENVKRVIRDYASVYYEELKSQKNGYGKSYY